MKPVFQTDLSRETGDCYRACIASLFELPIEEVPNFWLQIPNSNNLVPDQLIKEWWLSIRLWSESRYNLVPLDFKWSEESDLTWLLKDVYLIASGTSPRYPDLDHSVIIFNNKIVHDPHPSGVGFGGNKPKLITVFVATHKESKNGEI